MRPPAAVWRGVLVTALVFAASVLVIVALDHVPQGQTRPEARSERLLQPNARLKFCSLRDPETIDGIPCQKSTAWIWMTRGGAATTFHDNGRLSSCRLSADVTIDGKSYREGTHVNLDPDGKVIARPGQGADEKG